MKEDELSPLTNKCYSSRSLFWQTIKEGLADLFKSFLKLFRKH